MMKAEREGYEYADFYVDDPEQLKSIIRSVQEIDQQLTGITSM